MMKKVKVLEIGYSYFNHCVTITYEKEPQFCACAAVAEELSLKKGDSVWVLSNDRLNYKGFSAVAVLLA